MLSPEEMMQMRASSLGPENPMYPKFHEMASLCGNFQKLLDELHNLRKDRLEMIANYSDDSGILISLRGHEYRLRRYECEIDNICQLYRDIWVRDDTTFQYEINRINLENPKVKELKTIIQRYAYLFE